MVTVIERGHAGRVRQPVHEPAQRGEEYPTREGFYVMAAATVDTKVRGPMDVFDNRWKAVKVETRQLVFA